MNENMLKAVQNAPLYQKVIRFCKESDLFDGIAHFHVGFSGGADSTALLAILASHVEECRHNGAVAPTIMAHHIRHGLRDSDAIDMDTARNNARLLDVPFLCTELRLGTLPSAVEETARKARMDAFLGAIPTSRRGTTALALAHHGDENLETLLWRISRGCGLEGAVLQPRTGTRDGIARIRPLLCAGKDEIIRFLVDIGLNWAEDPTNREDHYLRNRIRHRVLPRLRELFQGADAAHSSLLRIAGDAGALDAFAEQMALQGICMHSCICRRDAFEKLDPHAQIQFLRHAARHCVPGHIPDAGFVTRARQMIAQNSQKHRIQTNQTVTCSFNRRYVWLCADEAPAIAQNALECPLPCRDLDVWQMFSMSCRRFTCEDVPPNTTRALSFVWNEEAMRGLTVMPAARVPAMTTSDGRSRSIRSLLRDSHIPAPLAPSWPVLTSAAGPLWILAGPRSIHAAPPKSGDRAIICTIQNSWF